MPSDICFNCGKLSKFLVVYPELQTSVKANQVNTSPTNTSSRKFNNRRTRNPRERKLQHRANNLLVKTNALTWQFTLDGGLRDIGLHGAFELLDQSAAESKESFGIEADDIQICYDVWRELAKEGFLPLDDDQSLHYLGQDLMEDLDMCAENQSMMVIDEDAKAENPEDEKKRKTDADDEDSEYGGAEGSDGDSFPTKKLVAMARHCTTMTFQWEPSRPVERISREARPLYNDLCAWNFTDATSPAISGATLVEDEELSPLTSDCKFSFEYELESMDWDRNSNCSTSASVRGQLVECRVVVGGQAYEWDIFL